MWRFTDQTLMSTYCDRRCRLRITRSLFFLMLAFVVALPVLKAQDQSEPQLQWGGFGIQGSASVGYRFTDVKGYEPMYEELLNLKSGPRLMDFSIFGHNNDANAFANDFSLTMSGLGGDPYPGVQLNVSKAKLYDLRVNWRQSYFNWNQNDNVFLPTRPGNAGLTDNHNWSNVRKLGSIDFTLHATNNLRFHFQYYRTSFSGTTFTTFSPDFLDSPSYFGTYARANAYYMYAPVWDNSNRIVGGLDYTWRDWNFHYNVGYQTFTDNTLFNNTSSPQIAIDYTTATNLLQPLSQASWNDYRELKTPVSEFSYTGKPYKWMSVRGGYMFYRYSGPASYDQSYNGIVQTVSNPATYAPYAVSQTGRVKVSEPNNIVQQGFTFYVKPWWDMDLDYRYTRFTTSTEGTLTSLYNGVTPANEEVTNNWKDGTSQLDFTMMFTPTSNLVIRPGVQLFETNIEMLEDGEADPARTLRIKTVSPTLSALYRPSKWFDIRGEIRKYNYGSSYTALNPHTNTIGRVVGSVHLNSKLTLSDELYMVSQRLLATDYHAKVQSNATTLTYTLNPKYSLFGGFTYDNEIATGITAYQRGVPVPGTSYALRDQALNRVWQAGLSAEPVKYFGIRFTGNFVRTTGLGDEAGMSPVYGPLTWPLGTGTVYFNIPKAGRLSVDLQRTYYIQQIITVNNFSANLLAIRWTRDF
jgi:hypothetical protein